MHLLKCFRVLQDTRRIGSLAHIYFQQTIMRTFKLGHFVSIAIAALAIPLQVSAQQPANSAPPPPQLEKLEEGEPPAVTIRPPENKSTITETRGRGGKVKEVKVTSGGSTYYLRPNDPAGSTLPGDTQSNTIRAAQWEVGTFGGPEEAKAREAAEANTPQPPADAPAQQPASRKK